MINHLGVKKNMLLILLSATVLIFTLHTAAHAQIENLEMFIRAIEFSPDGTRIAVARGDQLMLWDTQGNLLFSSQAHGSGGPFEVAWSPDGTKLATGGLDHFVRIWDAATFTNTRTLGPLQDFWVTSVGWLDNQRVYGMAAFESDAVIWNVETGNEVNRYFRVTEISDINQDGDLFIVHSGGGISIIDAVNGNSLGGFGLDNGAFRVADWNPSGTQLVAGSDDGFISILNLTSQTISTSFQKTSNEIYDVAWSPDGQYIASVDDLDPKSCAKRSESIQ